MGWSAGWWEARDTIGGVFWVMVVVVAVVVFGTAAVAAGAGGTMAGPAPDPQPLAALDRPVNAADVEDLRFPVVFRGYRMDAVDVALGRLADELADRDLRIEQLEVSLGIRPAAVNEDLSSQAAAGAPWPPDTDLASDDEPEY
ncbi:MAG TPA: DivIVA domain-containing protein [Sporichthya sp.]|nr:DivIVA domain-containing protein [Sporichthya sp.]